jgi:hypothetical protein
MTLLDYICNCIALSYDGSKIASQFQINSLRTPPQSTVIKKKKKTTPPQSILKIQ